MLIEDEIQTMLLKVDNDYAPLLCTKIEYYFNDEKIDVYMFIGNGSVLICLPKKSFKSVSSEIKKMLIKKTN